LLQIPVAQQRNAVRHHHRFFLVVRDKQECDAQLSLQRLQLQLHVPAQVGVQRRERLVEQQQARPLDQCACQRHPLLLPAADASWLGVGERRHLHFGQRFSHALRNLARRNSFHPQSVRDVVPHRQVRKQRVTLEHGVDPSAVRRQQVEPVVAHPDFARGRRFKAGHQAQKRGLSRAALAQHGEEFALGYLQRNIAQHVGFAETLRNGADGEQDGGAGGRSGLAD